MGAVSALFRLQDTYNIPARDMANSNLPGKTADDTVNNDAGQ